MARGKIERNPAMEALKRHPRNFFVVLGARLAENGLGYLFPVFGLSYVITTLGVPRADALSALMLAFVIELFTIIGFAALSDRIGRRPVYMFGALAGIVWAFPFFWLVGTKEWIWIAVAFIGARAVVTAAMFGPQAAYFAELFPPQRRFAGFAFRARTGLATRRRTGAVRGGGAGGVVRKLVAGRMLRSTSWPACTALAIWSGPETYEESITVDNTHRRRGRMRRGGAVRAARQRSRWRSNSASCSRSGRWSGGGRMKPEWPLQTQLEMIRDAGFDGAGVRFIDPAFADGSHLLPARARHDLAGAVLSDRRRRPEAGAGAGGATRRRPRQPAARRAAAAA